jgi:hypothetical protein
LIEKFLNGRKAPEGKRARLQDYLGWILPLSITVALIPVIVQIRKHGKEEVKGGGDN